MDIFVARQPVFTVKKKVFGYELLFRHSLENIFPDIDGNVATANVLSNTFFSFGLQEILAGKPGLVNFTRDLILQKMPLLFPKEIILIEILEAIEPEPEIIESLRALKRQGFRLVLDDFIYHRKFEPFIDICSIIKFDLIATPLDTLSPVIKDIQSRHKITLLAEKVETCQEFDQAREMGFSLFQGYFFAKPEMFSKKDISPAQIVKMKLISELGQKDLNLARIEDLIKKDLAVSFKLVNFMNSAYFKRPTAINTIKDAMTFLGTDELRKFIHVVVISHLGENKPDELIRLSIIRARMCELCGRVLRTHFTTEELFTIGLFSAIDAILDKPMKDILTNITFSDKIKEALMGRDKQYRQIHSLVICFERGRWDNQLFQAMKGRKIIEKLPGFYGDALGMADAFLV